MTEPVAGYTEAEGYAASLRQQARLIAEGSIELDAEELEAAANFIERLTRCDAESAGLATFTPITGPGVDALENRKEADNGPSEEQVNANLRRYLVPPPSEAGRDRIAKYICHRFICANGECDECEPGSVAREHADTILAISRRDPGTVAVASAQYRCTCGAEPYCAPNVHAASCPLAVTSAHHCTPEGK